ncbi:maleylpyruvate isomerase family mycothiol-dependent enzyme [Actinoplanes sp. NPDC023801]|uniref:maleylpyruvate isomerase family mycothiol-dependent enzyme n=1 Tax=Actinoplanes sp. NPDC023801 TaxID=3154595 RepID=UPI0033FCFD38
MTHATGTGLWDFIRAARRSLADDLSGLDPAGWHQPTLCTGWDVEHVVAHLTAAATIGRWRWIRSILLAGFRPAVHNERRLREHLGSTPAETLRRFEAIVDATVAPSGDTAAYLGEVLVHSQDIRHPLGIGTEPDVRALTAVADFYARRDFAVPSKTLASGLRLTATDGPFTAGEGATVSGTTLALVMTMAGRRAYIEHLEGEGRDMIIDRLG